MSDPEVLSEAEIDELRSDLMALLDDLLEVLALSSEAARPVALDQPIGRLSRMDAMQQQSMLSANRAAARVRKQLVQSALRRIEDEDYGDCISCGEAIGYRRLKARPEAPLCVRCQSRREKT